ncbi:hypothetical protein ANCDUO_07819 [Ancylostoma duodenale]|uniref:Uncharacterized protein n=1 Tax=Ancylostoma duodenale TaxID=51022 RepID=A0A0C2DHI7_9BILA|nr:hypothetical protein ANCDUO_07819 [Ancylostoma duodenale]
MRRHRPLNATFDTGEELFLGTCDSREVGGVGVLFNTNLVMNIHSFEQLTTRIGPLRLRRCGSIPALAIFFAYALTSSYDKEEIKAFYMDLDEFYREDHSFYKPAFGKMPLSTTSTKNTIDLFNISATAQGNPRAQETQRNICLTRAPS